MPIRCEQAVELFDAYLDGELSPSLAMELGADRLQCAECRRRLALLEVSEHLITSDREPVQLKADFSDRLIACMEAAPRAMGLRVRRWLYVAVPVAAAAVVGLALLGLFDQRGTGLRAGRIVEIDEVDVLAVPETDVATGGPAAAPADAAWQAWYGQLRGRFEAKRRTVESFQQAFDLIIPASDWALPGAAVESEGAPDAESQLPEDAPLLEEDASDESAPDEDADDEEVEDL